MLPSPTIIGGTRIDGGRGSGEGEEATGMRSLGAGGRGRIGEGQELVRGRAEGRTSTKRQNHFSHFVLYLAKKKDLRTGRGCVFVG